MKLDENYLQCTSFLDCMTARWRLGSSCLGHDQNLPHINFFSRIKKSRVGNENAVFISLNFSNFLQAFSSFLKTMYKSFTNCTPKVSAYFYHENKASIFEGRLKPDKSLFSAKHTSLPVMTYTWAPPCEMKNDFIIKKKWISDSSKYFQSSW